jgi:membrane fusion protein (multidrug efflux system)
MSHRFGCFLVSLVAGSVALAAPAAAQRPPSGPSAVGVTRAETLPITETESFVGRIQAMNRVDLVARVTAFLEEQKFVEGAEVKPGEVLYRLEQGPFLADVAAKQAALEQAQAQLQLSALTLGRAQALLNTPAGQQSSVDSARATQLSNAAIVAGAQAQLDASKINLNYTEIHSPIAGKIGRTAVTSGNVVSPGSGVLATIVGQDPMYVVFAISQRTSLDLRQKHIGRRLQLGGDPSETARRPALWRDRPY